MFELFNAGGFIMYPLLICSLVVWFVTFEKIRFLNNLKKDIDLMFIKGQTLLTEKKFDEAKGLSHSIHPLLSRSYLTLFEGEGMKREQWGMRVGRRLTETQQGLKKSLWIIGTIGSSAPFIGLFGTVVGIIKSFQSIAISGKSGFTVVASGLSEALIATAAGIVVAVMAVILYNYFQNRLSRVNTEIRNRMQDLMDLI
ncbi:MotA/TolQ/ExbB proton channel family protein [Halobacteriovorax sp.]|uniref:MotA/TolQ/ExbB proton channel family protein n=1 Tax=Halobacteriovorax sp. TaxID=2020862 RepID=UPI00356750A9